jgi:hypothetical protein
MKQLIQKFQDYDTFYTTTVGVRKWDDTIVLGQEIKIGKDRFVTNIFITKKEFDNIVKFVNEKFKRVKK